MSEYHPPQEFPDYEDLESDYNNLEPFFKALKVFIVRSPRKDLSKNGVMNLSDISSKLNRFTASVNNQQTMEDVLNNFARHEPVCSAAIETILAGTINAIKERNLEEDIPIIDLKKPGSAKLFQSLSEAVSEALRQVA